MKISEYDYYLPEELIAQTPVEPRDASKLMVVDKNTRKIEDKIFRDIEDYFRKGDLLVRNSTKVIPARLFGQKETGGILEVFLLKRLELKKWEVLLKPAKKLKLNQILYFGENKELKAELIEIKDDGNRVLEFEYEGVFEDILERLGQMPLPPYIREKLQEKDRYQTIYAKKGESVAAPTAGLHFTKELFDKLIAKGVEIVDVYLEVGLGTFRPVQVDDIKDHKMHSEMYEVPLESAEKINKAKEEGRRVIAVGTTSVRTIESASTTNGRVEAKKGDTEIFIYPGYEFKIVDALITNFHLPKSTLLMLVSAFADKELMFEAYEKAVKDKYRFFSFGDAMFIYSSEKK
jgi:S-adenosylmethionine:tRNA ribosyltransferase-isomerase